jgi:hypothetical protein
MASLGMRAPVEVGTGFLTLLPRMATFEVPYLAYKEMGEYTGWLWV